jgi:hypothetical protein
VPARTGIREGPVIAAEDRGSLEIDDINEQTTVKKFNSSGCS